MIDIAYISQYGFGSNNSTSLVLLVMQEKLKLNEEITAAIERKSHTVGMLIYLKKNI